MQTQSNTTNVRYAGPGQHTAHTVCRPRSTHSTRGMQTQSNRTNTRYAGTGQHEACGLYLPACPPARLPACRNIVSTRKARISRGQQAHVKGTRKACKQAPGGEAIDRGHAQQAAMQAD
eukprot:363700-Chlamydomonas_euryale.AAC.2